MPVLSQGLAWPGGVFYEGGGVVSSDVVPAIYPVAIAGHPYNIEPKLYQLSHIPLRRPATDESAEPGEQSLSPEGLWRRSQSDWSLGAGQLWLDEAESTRRRFRQSLGIDCFNDREFSLLPATEEKRNSANTNLKLLRVGARLYVVDGATLIFSNGSGSEQNTTWVTGWTTATGLPGGNILDICTTGSHIYVLGSDNSIYRATPGTTSFAGPYYNPTAVATRIYAGLGRLFMSDGRSFYEVTATPGETLIFTHPDANYVMSALCAAPSGVYIGGNVGSEFGEVRNTWVNDAGTAFVAPVVAAEFLNERVNALRSVGNVLTIGTSVGFRKALIDNLATGLDYGPAVEIGEVRDIVIDSFLNPQGQLDTFAYATWTNINGGSESGLARLRLTRDTEPNVPAYASDIYSTGGGTVLTVASLSGRRYFGVSTDGFFGATANFVASGNLRTGRIRYGVLDQKVFSDLKWQTAPLLGRVIGDVEFDTGATANAGVQDMEGSVSNHHGPIGPVTAEWAEIVFTLERGGVITPALFFNGTTGTATTPDHANFAITDLDAEWTGALENWTPGTTVLLFGQTGIIANIAWSLGIDTTGHIFLTWSTDGTVGNSVTVTTTNPVEFGLLTEHTIAVTLDVNNGGGGRTLNILVDGALFETFGGAITSIFNSTAALSVGGLMATGNSYCLRATLRASIGGADVANPNFTIQTVGAASFNDTAGTPKTWTMNSPAAIELVHEDEDLTPRLRWWVMRSIPSAEEVMRFLVPLRLFEKEQTPLGPIKPTSYLDELDFLMALSNSKQIVKYQEGLRSYDVYVNNIEANPERWNSIDHGLEGIVAVEMFTVTHP